MPATTRTAGDDIPALALLFALALSAHLGTALAAARGVGVPLWFMAGFFDGSLYLEIAKSFPLPFPPGARDYAGQAPGYPALIYLARTATPAGLAHWGALALWASWIPAALCAVAFGALCRELGIRPLWPGVAFLAANPRWLWVAGTAHPEPLAVLCALLCARAYLRDRLGWAVLWLTLAGLSRFPAFFLGAALAYGTLVQRRRLGPRSLAWLAVPPLAFLLHNAYLAWRIPEFAGIADAHSVFLETGFTWPFAALAAHALPWLRGEGTVPDYGLAYLLLTWASLALYLAGAWVGLRARDEVQRFLGVWVLAIVLFHVSLSGEWSGFDFMRLAILAWPAALLILWRRFAEPAASAGAPLRAGIALAACASLWIAVDWVTRASRWQGSTYPWPTHAIRGFRSDEPRWVDYRGRFAPPPAIAPARPDAP